MGKLEPDYQSEKHQEEKKYPFRSNQEYPNENGFIQVEQKLDSEKKIIKELDHSELEECEEGQFLEGLPNLQNSCYLNSVLQLFFSIPEFRQRCISSQRKRSLAGTLGLIFQSLKERTNEQDKVLLIQALTGHLPISPYIQNDALNTLTLILNQLDKRQDKQNDFSSLFRVELTQSCKCQHRKVINDSIYLSFESQICAGCEQPFEKIFLKEPKYLLFSGEIKEPAEYLKLNTKYYQLESKILFKGNSPEGHYVCVRSCKNQRYLFNDSVVSKQSQSLAKFSQNFKTKLLLYKQTSSEIPHVNYQQIKNMQNNHRFFDNKDFIIAEKNIKKKKPTNYWYVIFVLLFWNILKKIVQTIWNILKKVSLTIWKISKKIGKTIWNATIKVISAVFDSIDDH